MSWRPVRQRRDSFLRRMGQNPKIVHGALEVPTATKDLKFPNHVCIREVIEDIHRKVVHLPRWTSIARWMVCTSPERILVLDCSLVISGQNEKQIPPRSSFITRRTAIGFSVPWSPLPPLRSDSPPWRRIAAVHGHRGSGYPPLPRPPASRHCLRPVSAGYAIDRPRCRSCHDDVVVEIGYTPFAVAKGYLLCTADGNTIAQ